MYKRKIYRIFFKKQVQRTFVGHRVNAILWEKNQNTSKKEKKKTKVQRTFLRLMFYAKNFSKRKNQITFLRAKFVPLREDGKQLFQQKVQELF